MTRDTTAGLKSTDESGPGRIDTTGRERHQGYEAARHDPDVEALRPVDKHPPGSAEYGGE